MRGKDWIILAVAATLAVIYFGAGIICTLGQPLQWSIRSPSSPSSFRSDSISAGEQGSGVFSEEAHCSISTRRENEGQGRSRRL